MLFNSLQFLIFFPTVTLLYFLLPHKFRWILLLFASCIFYSAFIPIYILILFFTIIVDYYAGIMIEKAQNKNKKTFLIASILANIGILAVFKYYNFFIENINYLANTFQITTTEVPFLNIILPIGLSFHTFQAMSYTIEVYRGNQKAERRLGIYALYVMFYPQLVAGPIERPQNLIHQFKEEHYFDSENLLNGLRLMLWGLFKKVVIADRIAVYVNSVYGNPADYHYLNLVIATLLFSIQIYCDFSGYSDIAIGAAKTMGFDLMTNFNRPYLSRNIQEFWKRWHISLSNWFKDYLYISLGGNRVSQRRIYFNVSIVFIISGFWHGANWTFIIWGALHTCYILIYMISKQYFKLNMPKFYFSNTLSIIFTFILVSFAWIFFRSNNLNDAMILIKNICTLNNTHEFKFSVTDMKSLTEFGLISSVISIVMIIIMFVFEYNFTSRLNELIFKPKIDAIVCTLILVIIVFLGVFYNNSFIYFQF